MHFSQGMSEKFDLFLKITAFEMSVVEILPKFYCCSGIFTKN